jgi:thiol:disulfide interchange protein DsbD
VIDVLGEGLRATATRSAFAYPLVFAAGALTSAGPCAAPRYVAVAALANAPQRPWRVAGAFIAGLAAAYVAFGLAAASLATLWASSRAIYAGLALAMIASSVVTLFREPHAGCADRCDDEARTRVSLGGTFLLGGASALVVSPCCTPVLAAIAGLTASSGRAADGVLLSLTFACGHAAPLAAVGALGARFAASLSRWSGSHAVATVSGALMFALGAYYGALA